MISGFLEETVTKTGDQFTHWDVWSGVRTSGPISLVQGLVCPQLLSVRSIDIKMLVTRQVGQETQPPSVRCELANMTFYLNWIGGLSPGNPDALLHFLGDVMLSIFESAVRPDGARSSYVSLQAAGDVHSWWVSAYWDLCSAALTSLSFTLKTEQEVHLVAAAGCPTWISI